MNFGIVALLMGFLFYVTPRVSRPGLLFGVTVDPALARGWVARNPRVVYGLIGVIGLLCAMMLLIRCGVRHWSRRVASECPAAQAETGLLIAVEYLMVTIAWVALFATAQGAVVLGIATVVLTVALILALLRMGQGGNRMAPGGPAGDRTPDACWKWGLFYINRKDPALFVEKRFGVGYTVNLGNRWSWIFLAITLLPLVFIGFFLR